MEITINGIVTDVRVVAIALVIAWLIWMWVRVASMAVGQTKTFNVLNGALFWFLFGRFLKDRYRGHSHRNGFKIRREDPEEDDYSKD